ncbi:serine/threonine-protein phosphatase 6 regulatory ankyrin repeat subunit A-like isoform X2 [Ostrea edulis]|uniref:serine/threonine-protein phosphatase 6 regulatory ankyrin repeat subunit A-like isoform X2 n=1 Tax=Ostrea edulis TaxID=37623 RepID=UPI0024AFDD57|nr:serine/threonine-protein phosphatase 6 regulatory ankyrin repeat subunit A-like isoform X2 [Ostrea edulis]
MGEPDKEFLLMENFENLKTHFKIDCAKFLGNILLLCLKNIENLTKSDKFALLDMGSQNEICKRNSFILSVPVLCDIILKGMCEEHMGNFNWYLREEGFTFSDDVARLRDIWKLHIVDNDDERISEEDKEHIWSEINAVGERMGSRFREAGKTYLESIRRLKPEEIKRNVYAGQYGDKNKMEVNFEEGERDPFFVEQFGNNNKMIVQLYDRRQPEQLQIKSSGRVKLRMVLRANETREWNEITENVMNIDLQDLNSNPLIRENDIVFESFEKGCLVINLNISDEFPIKTLLHIVFEILFEELKATVILQKYETSEVQIFGYFYCPEEFKKKGTLESPEQDASLYSHQSWENASTICDIDIYMSDLMKHLILSGFSTDVDELIDVQIKCDIVRSDSPIVLPFQSSLPEDKEKLRNLLEEAMKTMPLQLESLNMTRTTLHLLLKCRGKMKYASFVDTDGSIIDISKTLLFDIPMSMLRVSVCIDTNLVNDSITGQGLIFYLSPLSKVSDAIKTGKISRIITAMLEGKSSSVLRNVEELKMKAVLEYQEDKGSPSSEFSERFLTNTARVKSEQNENSSMETNLENTLLTVCEMGNPNLARQLLERGENPNFRNDMLQTPLHLASERNHLRVVEQLLLHGAEVNAIDKNRETPLITASRRGNWKIVSAILKYGADVELCDTENHTPLYMAVERGHRRASSILLKAGANVNSNGHNSCTPLHIACSKGYLLIVKDLLSYGSDVHCTNRNQNTPLHSVLLCDQDELNRKSIIEDLVTNGAFVNKVNDRLKTPLCIASERGLLEATGNLLEAGADVHLTDDENNLPLHLASKNGHIEVVKELLQYCVDIDRCNVKGLTPRMLAAEQEDLLNLFDAQAVTTTEGLKENIATLISLAKRGMLTSIDPFVQKNELVDTVDSTKRSLLYFACENGHIDVVRLLISFGANINACDSSGKSPLSVAAENRFHSIVEALISAGADTNTSDYSGRTCLHYAAKSGSFETVDLLLKHRDTVYKPDIEGVTPLHLGVKHGSIKIAQCFLVYGIDVNECDLQNTSPLFVAIAKAQSEIADFLIRHGADVNLSDEFGRSPLHIAAEIGSIRSLEILLNNDANVNQTDKLKKTPLFKAVEKGKNVVLTLINHGADVNLCDSRGRSPLHTALENGHLFAMRTLLHQNASVNIADEEGLAPLHLSSTIGSAEGVELLLTTRATVNAVDGHGRSPLHLSTSSVITKRLLQCGAHVNTKDKYGKSPLHYGVEHLCEEESNVTTSNEYISIISELFSNEANICLRDNDMNTVIHKAVGSTNYHVLIELLSYDTKPDLRNNLLQIVKDISNHTHSGDIRNIMEHWMGIQQLSEESDDADSVDETETCPAYLYQQHEEWLKAHSVYSFFRVFQKSQHYPTRPVFTKIARRKEEKRIFW